MKLTCKCNNLLCNVAFPNLVEGSIKSDYSDNEYEVWECDKCGRLSIEISNENGCELQWYIREIGSKKIFKSLIEEGSDYKICAGLPDELNWKRSAIYESVNGFTENGKADELSN